MTIFLIAIGVCVVAFVVWLIAVLRDGRKQRRRVEEFRQDIARQERTAGESWEHEKARILAHLEKNPLVKRVELPTPPKDDTKTLLGPEQPR
jgi:hypothetical protein